MTKFLLFAIGLILASFHSTGQVEGNVIYIVDSIPVIEDPEDENEIVETEIADVTVIKSIWGTKSLTEPFSYSLKNIVKGLTA